MMATIIFQYQSKEKNKRFIGMCLFLALLFLGTAYPFTIHAAEATGTIPAPPAGPSSAIPPTEVLGDAGKGQKVEHSNIIEAPSAEKEATPDPEKAKRIPSLFFTYWQHQSILDALQSRGGNSGMFNEEFMPENLQQEGDEKLKKPQNREIALSGIVFVHPKDWTVWLNGMRLTPDATPVEVIDIKVFKDHIDLKWHDVYTNKIFPIRIRPHQRFNLDTRVFLPG